MVMLVSLMNVSGYSKLTYTIMRGLRHNTLNDVPNNALTQISLVITKPVIPFPSHSVAHPEGGTGVLVFWCTARQASVVSPGVVGPTHHQVLARPARGTTIL